MFRLLLIFVGLALAVGLLSGCGTIANGYYDEVILTNAPPDLRIQDQNGVDIPVEKRTEKLESVQYKPVTITLVALRSKRDHVLTFQSAGKEIKLAVDAKLHVGYFLLDMVTGVGLLVDGVTGNWNRFTTIDCGQVFEAAVDSSSNGKK